MGYRDKHLAQFEGLPERIWEAHHRVAAAPTPSDDDRPRRSDRSTDEPRS
jgi:hypothetical protein